MYVTKDTDGPNASVNPRPLNPSRRSRTTARRRARRRRQRRVSLVLAGGAACLLLAVFLLPCIHRADAPESDGLSDTDTPAQTLEGLRQLAQSQPQAQQLLDHPQDYPLSLLELAVRNPETLDFVAAYPQSKDLPAAQDVGNVTRGSFPLLMQWDSRWGYQTYGDDLLAITGCGPTVVSMAVCGLTGDNTVTPWTVAQYADQAGWYVSGTGSSWDLIREGCRHYGLEVRELPLDEGNMVRALEQGEAIICSMGPGDFTTSGHFILLTGVEDGKFRLNDPNRRSNSEKLWDYETLAPQIRNLWACSPA